MPLRSSMHLLQENPSIVSVMATALKEFNAWTINGTMNPAVLAVRLRGRGAWLYSTLCAVECKLKRPNFCLNLRVRIITTVSQTPSLGGATFRARAASPRQQLLQKTYNELCLRLQRCGESERNRHDKLVVGDCGTMLVGASSAK